VTVPLAVLIALGQPTPSLADTRTLVATLGSPE
jgi:hypothetical protein